MRNLVVADLDEMAREGVKSGQFKSLRGSLYVMPGCHPSSGVKITRTYEGNVLMLSCVECNKFVCNIKVAQE